MLSYFIRLQATADALVDTTAALERSDSAMVDLTAELEMVGGQALHTKGRGHSRTHTGTTEKGECGQVFHRPCRGFGRQSDRNFFDSQGGTSH
jgi:hypothetical protein